jgi:hypothetical protein|tara:strand:+ start:131 stop:319 length:189 start_codon:yes stop_codon:yes gene_type:complete
LGRENEGPQNHHLMKKGAQLNFQFAEDTKAKAAGAKLLQTPRPRPRGQSEAWRAQGALNVQF